MRTTLRLAVVLALALSFRLANLVVLAQHPLAEYQATWNDADMAVNVRWADGIRAGDLLCRRTVHPFYPFHESIAPRETWERWWGGKEVFQQAPLYPYVLAGLRALGGEGFFGVALGQLALGLASVALVFLVAARVFDERVATLAGAGAAIYGPLVFHEAVWLRDTLAVTTSLLALWALGRAPQGGRARWLAAGVALAAAFLTRETALLFLPLAGVWAWRRLGRERRARALGALALGLALGLLPLVARNLAVGAPALSFSTRGLEGFVHGHAADASPTDLALSQAAKEILPAADGSLLAAMRLTLATHASAGDFLLFELRKALAILAGYEPADNVSWYYFAEHSPVLRFSPGFAVVLALGLVGLLLARRRGPDEPLLCWFLLATFLGLMYGTLAARYRLVAVAVLMIYAAAALVGLLERARERRWRAVAGIALAALALAFASTRLYAGARAARAFRPIEPMLAALAYQKRGETERALAELRAGLAHARDAGAPSLSPERLQMLAQLARIAVKSGRGPEVQADVDALVEEFPEDRALRRLAGEFYRDVLKQPERAAGHLDAAERARQDPGEDG